VSTGAAAVGWLASQPAEKSVKYKIFKIP